MSNKEMQQIHLPLPTSNDKNNNTTFCAQMSNKESNGPHLMTTATLCLLIDTVAPPQLCTRVHPIWLNCINVYNWSLPRYTHLFSWETSYNIFSSKSWSLRALFFLDNFWAQRKASFPRGNNSKWPLTQAKICIILTGFTLPCSIFENHLLTLGDLSSQSCIWKLYTLHVKMTQHVVCV